MPGNTRRVAGIAAPVIAVLTITTGCSPGTETDTATTSPPATTTATSDTHTPAPGAVEVSPDGVTTAIGTPADSTEEEYFQACIAARDWMAQQGGDRKSQVDAYLKSVQTSDTPGPGTFGAPWSQLEPARQAAVIVAVQAAADELCG